MALKSVDDVDNNGFDDELTTTKIAYLTKNFRNFLRNNNRRAKGKNNAEPRKFKRNEPTKVNNTNKSYGCKSEYPTFLRSKGKSYGCNP